MAIFLGVYPIFRHTMLNSWISWITQQVQQVQQVQGVLKLADFGLAREFVDFQMLSKLSKLSNGTHSNGGKMGKDTSGHPQMTFVTSEFEDPTDGATLVPDFSSHGDIPGNIGLFFGPYITYIW